MAKRSLFKREVALQKRRRAAEDVLQWHQKLLEDERKITELEMAASNIINQVPTVSTDNSTLSEKYRLHGSQLNVLWENMTGRAEKKFNDSDTCNLSQLALERFCKEAKKYPSKNKDHENLQPKEITENLHQKEIIEVKTPPPTIIVIAPGENEAYSLDMERSVQSSPNLDKGIKQSDSTLNEIIQNITNITDEISELFKLSSIKTDQSIPDLHIINAPRTHKGVDEMEFLESTAAPEAFTDSRRIPAQSHIITTDISNSTSISDSMKKSSTIISLSYGNTQSHKDVPESSIASVSIKTAQMHRSIESKQSNSVASTIEESKNVLDEVSTGDSKEANLKPADCTYSSVDLDNSYSKDKMGEDVQESSAVRSSSNKDSTQTSIPSDADVDGIKSSNIKEHSIKESSSNNLEDLEINCDRAQDFDKKSVADASKEIDVYVKLPSDFAVEENIATSSDITESEKTWITKLPTESIASQKDNGRKIEELFLSKSEHLDQSSASSVSESVKTSKNSSVPLERTKSASESIAPQNDSDSSKIELLSKLEHLEDHIHIDDSRGHSYSQLYDVDERRSASDEFIHLLQEVEVMEDAISIVSTEHGDNEEKNIETDQSLDKEAKNNRNSSMKNSIALSNKTEEHSKSDEDSNKITDFLCEPENISDDLEKSTDSFDDSASRDLENGEQNVLFNEIKSSSSTIDSEGTDKSNSVSINKDIGGTVPIISVTTEEKNMNKKRVNASKNASEGNSSEEHEEDALEEPNGISENLESTNKFTNDKLVSTSSSKSSKSQVNVKQRVSEILARANINVSIGDKSPRLQNLYVTAYDVISPEDSPELGSPVENQGFVPVKNIYGNEAEELLRKQLAIEQEIKQLEQQQKEQLPYLYMREIPNKPPPPYKPPIQPTATIPPTVLPMTVDQINSMTPYITKLLYRAQKSSSLSTVSLPDDKTFENIDRECSEFIFDLCKELATHHFRQFEEDESLSCFKLNKRTTFKRQMDENRLKKLFDENLLQTFGFKKVELKESMIIKWSRKKRDHVDELLVAESQAEEAEWRNYDQDELIVKNDVTNNILSLLMNETLAEFKHIISKKVLNDC